MFPPNAWVVYGPPGCGKTTHVAELARAAAHQYGPDRVLISSLTRTAAAEVRRRQAGRQADLPAAAIGTLHSFAYRALGCSSLPDGAEPDFDHLLERALTETHAAPGQPAVMILDEAQDHSPLDLALACHWARHCERLVLVGDPDQAIYGFRGAAGVNFQSVPAERKTVLAQSYRLPRAVHQLATAWIAQIDDREPVIFAPRDAEGRVRRLKADGDRLARSVRRDLALGQSVMVLAACRYLLNDVTRSLAAAVPPPWWCRWLARWRPALSPLPAASLTVGTIHSVKGAEADVVYVLPDLSPAQWRRWDDGERDELVRLFYVAITRARQEVVLVSAVGERAVAWEC